MAAVPENVVHSSAAEPRSFPPEVRECVPHAGAMVFLDEIVAAGEGFIECLLTVREVHRMLSLASGEGASVPLWFGLECMAQCAAVYSGYRARDSAGPAKVGFLLGTRKLRCHCGAFYIGQTLKVRAELDACSGPTALFSCSIHDDSSGQLLQDANLHVHVPDNPQALRIAS